MHHTETKYLATCIMKMRKRVVAHETKMNSLHQMYFKIRKSESLTTGIVVKKNSASPLIVNIISKNAR